MIWPFSLFKRRNQDLSERFEGKLEITIEGVCSETMVFDYDTLASHVACVYLAHGGDCVYITDIQKSPWEVVSFDREARKLIVRPI